MSLLADSIRRSLALVGNARRGRWIALIGLALAVTAFEAVGAALVFVLISLASPGHGAVTLPLIGNVSRILPQASEQTAQVFIALLVGGFFMVRAVVMVGHEYAKARLVYNAGAQVADRLVRGYLAMPYLFHTQRNSAELVRNAFDSTQRLVGQVLTPLVQVLAEGVLVMGLTIVLLIVSPGAAALAVLTLGPTVWLLQRVIQPRLKLLGRRSQLASQGSLQSIQQALGGVRDIRLLSRERYFAGVFREHRFAQAHSEYLRSALSALPRTLIETALIFVIIGVFLVALLGGGGVQGVLSTLAVFAYIGLRLMPSLRMIVNSLNNLRYGSAVLDDLHGDMVLLADLQEGHDSQLSRESEPFRDAIELKNVSFSYARGDVPALAQVDLTVRRGEFIGVCGPTGGGKSTLVDLIAGLLIPTVGELHIDGAPLCGRERWWYGQLGVVSQSVFLIDDTLRANIAFGRSGEELDEDRLAEAVATAQLEEVIYRLPEGLDTVVGERGIRLSGGQRQRVAIARALYRDPAVMIFDEGTSALDVATEAALVAALDRLQAGRTFITVAHRISTVRNADRIVVVAGGRIAGEGSYEELIAENELFKNLAL